MSSRATSRDVAALAGVSVATVSYVMNGRLGSRIPEETRDRVLDAARRLAYAPNQSARSLRRRQTQRICLVVGSIGVPVFDQLARDLHQAADDAGYSLITIVVDSVVRAEQTLELLRQRITDGAVIVASPHHFSEDALGELARSGLPLVVKSNTVAPNGFDVVREPEVEGCSEALDHLFHGGRRRIAFLGHEYELGDAVIAHGPSERLSAYLAAIERHGAEPATGIVVPGADDRIAAYHSVAELLARPHPPDAIFAASDRAARFGRCGTQATAFPMTSPWSVLATSPRASSLGRP